MDVSGFFILMGCFPVFLGYYTTDVLSNEMFKYGLMGALFSLIGFYIGEKIRGGIKKDLFKKLLLIFFTFIASNKIHSKTFTSFPNFFSNFSIPNDTNSFSI